MNAALRVAAPSDAEALAALGTKTFEDTFGHLYPAEDLAAFLDEAHSPKAWSQLLSQPSCRTWVAQMGAQAVGYAVAGPCKLPHPEVTGGAGELQRLYVLQAHQGAGLGTRLFEEAMAWLASEGRRPVWLGVYSENPRAQALYTARGFEVVGEYAFAVGRSRDRELIMRRA